MVESEAIVSGIENCVKNHPPLNPPVKGGDEELLSPAGEGRERGNFKPANKA